MTDSTLLLRQVHPCWVQQGRVTSQAFRPTPKDAGLLSVYDGDLITAEESWIDFETRRNGRSVGVQGILVSECRAIGLSARSDPEAFAEHAVVDFTGLGARAIERCSKQLRNRASDRGWLHRAEADS